MQRKLSGWIVVALVAALGMAPPALHLATAGTPASGTPASPADNDPLGRAIDDFVLDDCYGKPHRLTDLDAQQVVVAFLGIECPLVHRYVPRLNELADEYRARGVAFLALDPNRQDSLAEMAHFVRTSGLNFPLLKDVGNRVADRFGAIRTPEVFVLDGERRIRYWGRVDDQYGFQQGVGYQRPEATRRDLAEALDELLAGRPVSEPLTRAPGCLIGRVRPVDDTAEVTYSNQIARIFQERCETCHRPGEIGPFAMTDYEQVAGWADMIAEVVRERRMPPWHADPRYGDFVNDCRLSDADRVLIEQWVAAGAPEGDPADLPPPREYSEGWQIDTPDQVIYMSDEPYIVPAQGTVEYQYYVVDPGWQEEKWVRAAECRPGARGVVHHILVFVVPPGVEAGHWSEGSGAQHLLAGMAPGNPPTVLSEGMAARVPAGSKLLFQMHYTANGYETADRSSLGVLFADPQTIQYEVRTNLAINPFFEVPAGAADHVVEARKKLRQDTLLIALMPHMHLRGKAFRYEAQYPDGRCEVLLDVPHYDFNWQNSYYLREPRWLPEGTVVLARGVFDNSAENLANPDPTQPVRWGEQTWEEMMIGWFVQATPRTDGP